MGKKKLKSEPSHDRLLAKLKEAINKDRHGETLTSPTSGYRGKKGFLSSANYPEVEALDVPITNRDSLARQRALRSLREGLTDRNNRDSRFLGQGLWADVYGRDDKDYVLKVPRLLVDEYRDMVSKADFWDDIRHKARVDAVLGEDLSLPTYAIETSKGKYGIQDRGDLMDDHFYDLNRKVERGPMGKNSPRLNNAMKKRAYMDRMGALEDMAFEADVELDKAERKLRTLMKDRDSRIDDIVAQQQELIRLQKRSDKLNKHLKKAEAVYFHARDAKLQRNPIEKIQKRLTDNLLKDVRKKGVEPSDLHSGNIAYDKKAKRAKVLDSGLFEVPVVQEGKFNPAAVEYNKAGSSRIISKKVPKIKKYLKSVPYLGPAIGAATLLAAPSAEAKQEVIGETLGSSGLSSPDELEFENNLHRQKKYESLMNMLREQDLNLAGGIPHRLE